MTEDKPLIAWINQRRKEANVRLNIHRTRLMNVGQFVEGDGEDAYLWLQSFLNLYVGKSELELLEKLERRIGIKKYKIVGGKK